MKDLIPSLFVQMFGDPVKNPKEWQFVTLGAVCEKPEYGYTASASKACIGPRLLRITDLQDGTVDWPNVPFCECADASKSKYLVSAGDIVVARIGATTGKSYIVRKCPESVFASYLIRLRPTKQLLPECLFAFMNTSAYWVQINAAKSSRLKHGINIPVLSGLKFPLPLFLSSRNLQSSLRTLRRRRRGRRRAERNLTNSLTASCRGPLQENLLHEHGGDVIRRILGTIAALREKQEQWISTITH